MSIAVFSWSESLFTNGRVPAQGEDIMDAEELEVVELAFDGLFG